MGSSTIFSTERVAVTAAGSEHGLAWRPRPRPLASVELDGETILYQEDSGGLHVLNPTATLVWRCLDGAVSLGELAGDIAAALGADPDAVGRDLLALAQQLDDEGLLERSPAREEQF
ncbi:MAG: PqqD family protein [Actinomycetota bacterium]|nr:PqqD family protein [Actinomycetota bacterium]